MGYLDTAKRTTRRRVLVVNTPERRYKTPATDSDTRHAVNDINDKSPELPGLCLGEGDNSALRDRVLQLGAERGYPALELGGYHYRNRVVNVGLFAGKFWWEHQTNYFGRELLDKVITQLSTGKSAPR